MENIWGHHLPHNFINKGFSYHFASKEMISNTNFYILTTCFAEFFICWTNFVSKRLMVSFVAVPWKSFASMLISLLLLVFVEVMSINEPMIFKNILVKVMIFCPLKKHYILNVLIKDKRWKISALCSCATALVSGILALTTAVLKLLPSNSVFPCK